MTTIKVLIQYIILFAILSTSSKVHGQSLYYVNIQLTDTISHPLLEKKWDGLKLDSTQLIFEMGNIVKQLHALSFLEASIEKVYFGDSTATIHIKKGPEYKLAALNIYPSDEVILNKAGYQKEQINGKALNMNLIGKLYNDVVTVLENNGYPFATIGIGNYTSDAGSIAGDLLIDRGRMITMDTFNLYGLEIINKNYLYNYLQIRPGDPYSAAEILKIKNRIDQLQFIRLSEDPKVRFIGNRAIINLKIEEIDASKFDFIIGVLPNNANAQNYTISGDLNFQIQNKLNQGEQLSIKYERLRPETQKMDVNLQYPYLLSLPFGFETDFNFFRNKNQNRDLNFTLGILYQLKANRFLKAFWNTQSSRLIEINEQSIIATGKLPSSLDVSINNFGLQTQWQDLDYRFNPRRGYQFLLRATAGQKSIIPNNNILTLTSDNIDFTKAYDSLDLTTYQFKLDANAQYFLPVLKRGTILTSITLSKIISERSIYLNEYSRIGGNQLLRGFDEESIWAEFFVVSTLEYRLLLSKNAFLSTFIDYGIRQNKYEEGFEWDQPFGVGAGFSLETAAGIFGINVAIGSEKGNPVDFRNTKTHMGFISLF